jgi:hypothetical protein
VLIKDKKKEETGREGKDDKDDNTRVVSKKASMSCDDSFPSINFSMFFFSNSPSF